METYFDNLHRLCETEHFLSAAESMHLWIFSCFRGLKVLSLALNLQNYWSKFPLAMSKSKRELSINVCTVRYVQQDTPSVTLDFPIKFLITIPVPTYLPTYLLTNLGNVVFTDWLGTVGFRGSLMYFTKSGQKWYQPIGAVLQFFRQTVPTYHLKGTVSRDFWPPFFFIKLFLWTHWVVA